MTRPTEIDLMLLRLLRGELSPEAANRLRERMLREPELAAAYRRLETGWQSLELPPPSPVPVGFSTRVLARARQSATAGPSWSAAPVWIRATAAAALVTGVVLGAGIGALRPPTPVPAAPAPAARAIPATPKTTTTATTTTTPGGAPTPGAEPAAPPAATPTAEPTPAPATEATGAAETAESVADLDFGDDLAATYWQDVATATESSDGSSEPDAAATPNETPNGTLP